MIVLLESTRSVFTNEVVDRLASLLSLRQPQIRTLLDYILPAEADAIIKRMDTPGKVGDLLKLYAENRYPASLADQVASGDAVRNLIDTGTPLVSRILGNETDDYRACISRMTNIPEDEVWSMMKIAAALLVGSLDRKVKADKLSDEAALKLIQDQKAKVQGLLPDGLLACVAREQAADEARAATKAAAPVAAVAATETVKAPEPVRATPPPPPPPPPPQPSIWRWLLPLLGLIALGALLWFLLRPKPAAEVAAPTATAVVEAAAPTATPMPEPTAAPEPTAVPEATAVPEPTVAPTEAAAVTLPAGVTCDGSGKVLLWHAWTGAEGEALDEILANWKAACPGIEVETLSVSFDELKNKFSTSAAAGGGPDFLIGPVDWIGELAEGGFLKDISGLADDAFLANYTTTAVDALRYKGGLYAIPESIEAVAMYYNKSMVETPPTTVDELLEAAAAGNGIGLNRGFYHAFWGVPANGGKLFDEDGVCVLDQGGFAQWLDWLAEHQNDPGMNLSNDYGKLNSLFKEGQVAFYPDGPWALGDLAKVLGEENIGVAPLPAGPEGASGPFLGVKNVMFNQVPEDAQTELALQFVAYLTSPEAQAILSEKAGHISANVNVTPANDAVAAFVEQSKTAYPFPNIPEMGAVWTPGDDAYTKVLEGVMTGQQAAAEACATINAANNK